MTNELPKARKAHNFSLQALERYRQFWSDGHMDRTEGHDFEADLIDLVDALKCVAAEDALGRCIGRANGKQLRRVVDAALVAADEWPERVA